MRSIFQILIVAVLVSECHGQRELQFKTKGTVAKSGNPRLIFAQKGFDLQCSPKGLNGLTVRENLAIVSEENRLQCTYSITENNCLWVNVSEASSYLSVSPQYPGNYICKCSDSKPCTPSFNPINALVYFIDPTKITILAPEPSLDIPTLIAANRTNFTLSCNASVPLAEPGFAWYRNGKLISNDSHNQMNGAELTVTFTMKSPNDSNKFSGMYMCEARPLQSNDGPLRAIYEVRGAPSIKENAKSQNKVEGERVTITCDFDGQPSPEVTWAREGDTPLPDGRISTGYIGVSTASLTIENLVPEDYGGYYCKAGDGIEARTLLRVRSRLAPLWPFLGIVAELLVLAAIIIIHEKRCAKKDEDEENDDGADRKQSPAGSNNEDDGVRNRKV